MKNTLSVVISAFNEEKKLGLCLSSVAKLADEMIVIDNTSTDKTAKIAKSFKASVYKRENNLMLNINKNVGFEKAKGNWILNLDADEEVTEELKEEIRHIVELDLTQAKKGYWIPRKNIIFGKWIQYGLWWPDKQLRLFQKESGKFPCKHIHEYIEVIGEIGELTEPYIHYNYDSVSQYLTKLERCTTSEAIALEEAQYQVSWFDAIRFPLSDFLKIFFAQSGYKDGLHGLVLSLFQGFYSFIVFTKLWEKEQFSQKSVTFPAISEEFEKQGREFSYWMLTAKIKESHHALQTFLFKIRRRLSI
jgi:glycosyltransferase involved in cell wall biosynthesis